MSASRRKEQVIRTSAVKVYSTCRREIRDEYTLPLFTHAFSEFYQKTESIHSVLFTIPGGWVATFQHSLAMYDFIVVAIQSKRSAQCTCNICVVEIEVLY